MHLNVSVGFDCVFFFVVRSKVKMKTNDDGYAKYAEYANVEFGVLQIKTRRIISGGSSRRGRRVSGCWS